jgi:hypothetical protein
MLSLLSDDVAQCASTFYVSLHPVNRSINPFIEPALLLVQFNLLSAHRLPLAMRSFATFARRLRRNSRLSQFHGVAMRGWPGFCSAPSR